MNRLLHQETNSFASNYDPIETLNTSTSKPINKQSQHTNNSSVLPLYSKSATTFNTSRQIADNYGALPSNVALSSASASPHLNSLQKCVPVDKQICHRTASQDSGLSTHRSTASSNSSTGQRPHKLSLGRTDSGLCLDKERHSINNPSHSTLPIALNSDHASKQKDIFPSPGDSHSPSGLQNPDKPNIIQQPHLQPITALQFRRVVSAVQTRQTNSINSEINKMRKSSQPSLFITETTTPIPDPNVTGAFRSDYGFIAYNTGNNIADYDHSPTPRKHKFISSCSDPTKSPKRSLANLLSSASYKQSTNPEQPSSIISNTAEGYHKRQDSSHSEVSGHESDIYDDDYDDSDNSHGFDSGWDTLYRMRSSFRSKLQKEKEKAMSKSCEPKKTIKDTRDNNIRNVFILRTQHHYGFTLSRVAGIGDKVIELDESSIAFKAGLKIADIIITINDQEVINLTHQQVVELLLSIPVSYTLRLGVQSQSVMNKSPSMPLQLGIPTNNPIQDGYLWLLYGKTTWKKRWFVLREDRILYYYKSRGDNKAVGALILDGYCVSKAFDSKRSNSFNVKKGGGQAYCFSAETEHMMTLWAQLMADAAEYQDENRDTIIAPCMRNVSYSALSIKKPDMHGNLYRSVGIWSWKRRYCVLKNAQLFVYSKMSDTVAEDVLHLFGYRVQEGDTNGHKHFFHMHPPEDNGKEHTFYVDTDTERGRWLKFLISSIKHAYIPGPGSSQS